MNERVYFRHNVHKKSKTEKNYRQTTKSMQWHGILSALVIILFIIKSYAKYKIDRKIQTESEKRKQHIQSGYNQTHTLENRSKISSHVNQTGRVNDSSLFNTMSCNRLDSWTRVFLLSHSEDPVVLTSFVWIGYQRVSDRQTDGRNCRRYYSALHCKQCGRAVKINYKFCYTSYNRL